MNGRIFAALALAVATATTTAAPLASTTVALDGGVTLRVVDAGPHDARATVVLIPGWRFTADAWSRQIETFSRTRRVIAFDPRSQGESTKATVGNTPEQRARDLDALLARLNVDRAVVVGWSQGVQDVAAYVAQFGMRRLRAIVLVDASVSAGAKQIEEDPAASARLIGMIDVYARAPERYTRGMLDAIIKHPPSPQRVDVLFDDAMKTPVSAGIAMLMADLFGVDRRPALAKIDVPLLVIAASASGELDEERAMAAKVPGARFETIDDAGHAVFIDQPERFDAILARFLDGLA